MMYSRLTYNFGKEKMELEKVIENWNDIEIDYKHNLKKVLILDMIGA